MKRTSLFIAAIALLSIAACQKIEAPEVQQEEPEIVAVQEEPAQEAVQARDMAAVAAVLNEAAQKEEIQLFIKDLILMVREGNDARHFEFGVSGIDGEITIPYVTGSLGLVPGELHPIAIDMDLNLMGFFTLAGQLDLVQIGTNYAKAALALDNITCEFYLKKASEGIGLVIADSFKMCFLRGENEKGKRTMELYMYDPNNPEFPPVSLSSLWKIIKG